jgi:hypothetical protein
MQDEFEEFVMHGSETAVAQKTAGRQKRPTKTSNFPNIFDKKYVPNDERMIFSGGRVFLNRLYEVTPLARGKTICVSVRRKF